MEKYPSAPGRASRPKEAVIDSSAPVIIPVSYPLCVCHRQPRSCYDPSVVTPATTALLHSLLLVRALSPSPSSSLSPPLSPFLSSFSIPLARARSISLAYQTNAPIATVTGRNSQTSALSSIHLVTLIATDVCEVLPAGNRAGIVFRPPSPVPPLTRCIPLHLPALTPGMCVCALCLCVCGRAMS